jgi:hypothetical protein
MCFAIDLGGTNFRVLHVQLADTPGHVVGCSPGAAAGAAGAAGVEQSQHFWKAATADAA